MGKQSRLKKERKEQKTAGIAPQPKERTSGLQAFGEVTPQQLRMAETYFNDMHGELEPLTEELITELIANGWEEKPLREAQAAGMQYSRKRNSFWGD